MKFIIIGSGGCVSIPRPTCQCSVCREARKKGAPYSRCGCSLYIEDANVLIDTPEDVTHALNCANVEAVDYIFYSHIDPDHTMGVRVIEQLRLDWLANSIGRKCERPIIVGTLPQILDDLKCQSTKYGSMLGYYEAMNLVTLKMFHDMDLDSIHVKLVPVDTSACISIFVFTEADHKLIYAPCDVKPWPDQEVFQNADCLIVGNTIIGNVLKNGFILENENPLRNELFVMDEIIELKRRYNIKRVIITHIEEDWGKSYDDYLKLQEHYEGIEFAYDGLKISL